MRGKTGWGWDFTPQVGWYVGYLKRDDRVYFFALNMDINKPEDARARIAITKNILRSMGLL
ncbi:penicillin-binding transpeptidase domain-containing protein [Chroococcidiopsis sp. CCNUC1]|uniref:penicillin-binding transpeptidase domain-containing protein n=1 Tax=Chroococcidiopsis sp. CCNUC1 TaxID=2653189 RepID=UPI00201FD86C|nr:penicillin-binding transpeptidase domain-containing protein [Chroococcidiopsis sp. CCNUC1]URD48973.1 penicillin-binding transpeptidase domain-containing protein [Chroococcidiopsis sp. CCNUC1]